MHEIIHVAESKSAIADARRLSGSGDSESARRGPALSPGYYVVLWPKRLSRRWRKRYFGPFSTLDQARMLETSAMVLGIPHGGSVIQPTRPVTEYSPAHQLATAAGGSWFLPRPAGLASDAAACVA